MNSGAKLVAAAILTGLVAMTLAGRAAQAAESGQPAAKSDRPSAEATLKQALANAARHATDAGGAGEGFAWNAGFGMDEFVAAYEAWKDPAWLDAGVQYYDFVVSKMQTGPDGYKGWIGDCLSQDKVRYWADVHIGDAVLLCYMLDFAELVLKDPALKEEYGPAAQRYVDLAKRDFIEKWDKRGTWREDGQFGAYVGWDTYCQAGDLKSWQKVAARSEAGLSLPFNKQNECGLVALKLFRITGDQSYRARAMKIFAFMKSRLQLVGDCYVWNYWEPFAQGDVDPKAGTSCHWMNVHGYRNYQAGEIGQIVEAYRSGIVFDKTDMERIINTNLKIMWNGDRAAPKFRNSNATLPVPDLTPEQKKAEEAAVAANPYAKEGRAGCLWTALVDFSPEVRELYALRFKDGKGGIAQARFENVTLKRPISFDQPQAGGQVTPLEFPFHECRSLTVTAVLPSVFKAGPGSPPAVIFTKARIPVALEIAVYSADGKEKLATLYSGQVAGGTDGHAGIFMVNWLGLDPAGKAKFRGDYRMRWTVPDGYREFKFTVTE